MTLPKWVKTQLRSIRKTQNYFKKRKINTVCETLRCPNRTLCYREPTATFMILGDICTRRCQFCQAEKGIPFSPDSSEAKRISDAVREMGLKYIVITSPTRDDLKDGGAKYFLKTVDEIRKVNKDTLVEVLVPDFGGNIDALSLVINSDISVFGHNIEVVKRLYGTVRDGCYERSLNVLRFAKEINSKIITKSGFMLGFGEREDEIIKTLSDLRNSGCDIVTVGQYLQPSKKALPVVEYIRPEIFEDIAEKAKKMGFKAVSCGPLVRSSTGAHDLYIEAKEAQDGKF